MCDTVGVSEQFFCHVSIQDQGLDQIADGVATLKNMAGDINEVKMLTCCLIFHCASEWLDGRWKQSLCVILTDVCGLCLQELDRQVPLIDEIDSKVTWIWSMA